MNLMLWFFLMGITLQAVKSLVIYFVDAYENAGESIFSIPKTGISNVHSFTRKDELMHPKEEKPEGKEILMHQSFDQSA